MNLKKPTDNFNPAQLDSASATGTPPCLSCFQNQDTQMASQPVDHQQCSVSRLYIERKKCTHTNMCTHTHTETSTRGQLHVPEHTGTYQPANHKVLVFLFCWFFFLFCFVVFLFCWFFLWVFYFLKFFFFSYFFCF